MGKTVTVDYVEGQKIDVYKDKETLDKMTEEELHEAALEDRDAQPLSEEQLKRFKRVNPNLPKNISTVDEVRSGEANRQPEGIS